MLGDQGLQEITYTTIEDKKNIQFKVTNAWFGITDKYWAATLLPDPAADLQARFSSSQAGTTKTYQTDYLLDAVTVAPGATGDAPTRGCSPAPRRSRSSTATTRGSSSTASSC